MSLGNWLDDTRLWMRMRRTIGQRRRSGEMDLPVPVPRISRTDTPYRHDCEFGRNGQRYWIATFHEHAAYNLRYHRMAGFLYMFARCPPEVRSILVNMSDGQEPSRARFSMSTNRPDVIPLPDELFFRFRGFREMRALAETGDVEWSLRSDTLTWRGLTNGEGRTDYSGPDAMWDASVYARIRMTLILKGVAGTDVAFVGSLQPDLHARLQKDRLVRDSIPETGWISDKYALDIDGFTNTWTNFLIRLHLGCCVLKVDSQYGYRQWYYDRIRAWEHFVPVRADMSDLVEKIDWVRTNDMRAREIAENGRRFARTMTFDSEMQWAVDAICAANGTSNG